MLTQGADEPPSATLFLYHTATSSSDKSNAADLKTPFKAGARDCRSASYNIWRVDLLTWAHCMRATFPSQSIRDVLSSGLAVQQSMTVCIPTSAAGRLVESFKSACTVVAPQSLRKSAGFCLGRTMHLTCTQGDALESKQCMS